MAQPTKSISIWAKNPLVKSSPPIAAAAQPLPPTSAPKAAPKVAWAKLEKAPEVVPDYMKNPDELVAEYFEEFFRIITTNTEMGYQMGERYVRRLPGRGIQTLRVDETRTGRFIFLIYPSDLYDQERNRDRDSFGFELSGTLYSSRGHGRERKWNPIPYIWSEESKQKIEKLMELVVNTKKI